MGGSASLMTASYAAQAGNSLVTAYASSEAYKAQGEYQSKISEMNAKSAESAARDAIKRGDVEAAAQHVKTKQIQGSQRAAAGASGLDLTTGSINEIMGETQQMGELDRLTIKNNAWREANGYKSQANTQRFQGEVSRISADSMARSTLVTGGLGAISSGGMGYYNYKKNKG